jgi:hypothetical protein
MKNKTTNSDPSFLKGLKEYINQKQMQIAIGKAEKEQQSEQQLNQLLQKTLQTKDGRPNLPPIPNKQESSNLDFPTQEDMGMSDNEYRQFMFEQGVYKDKDGYKQLDSDLNIQRRKIYEGEDIKDPNSMYNESGEAPGLMNISAPKENVETKKKTMSDYFSSENLDNTQNTLDAMGMTPGYGNPADVANTLISLSRGNFGDAALSGFAAIPGVGLYAGAIKKARKRIKFDKEGKVIKDKNFSDSFNQLEDEIKESVIPPSGASKYSYDALDIKRQALSIIKRLRSATSISDIKDILGKLD